MSAYEKAIGSGSSGSSLTQSCTPERQGEIPTLITNLNHELEVLADRVNYLHSKLEYALRQEPPNGPSSDPSPEGTAYSTGLGSDIALAIRKVRGLTNQISYLKDKIEL